MKGPTFTMKGFQSELARCPVVASVQAPEGSPLDATDCLMRLARASALQGVRILRAQGVDAISAMRAELKLPVIGLIKRHYEGSDVYLTPTMREVRELLDTGCEIIALDATQRPRPRHMHLSKLMQHVHEAGRLVMADCDSLNSIRHALRVGADIIGTTLAGYTDARERTAGADLELVREAVALSRVPVLAEGRFTQPWEVQSAMLIGASGVVIGGALNDPIKQTGAFLGGVPREDGPIGAFDIGGTWIRFGLFSTAWRLVSSERAALPKSRDDRLEWMCGLVQKHSLKRVAISTGGTVDPASRQVWEAKPLIPDHAGTDFGQLAPEVIALNDGLAASWGHACLADFTGRRVATLALGTGIGCGFVSDGEIWMGRRGEYSRLNDLRTECGTFEEMLGGAALSESPSPSEIARAQAALVGAVDAVLGMYFPDVIVICGGVGMAKWLDIRDAAQLAASRGASLLRSPFGADAGLYGAAALALFPPV